ncbi:hypothetical protein [Streptomyces canus]|uniref:hypothetical protein n=1 Tax=Streptomyces canus TaxID=58343 RepID=UPI003243C3FB
MQLPAEAVTATVLIEVVRISAFPTRRDVPYPGTAVAQLPTGPGARPQPPWP